MPDDDLRRLLALAETLNGNGSIYVYDEALMPGRRDAGRPAYLAHFPLPTARDAVLRMLSANGRWRVILITYQAGRGDTLMSIWCGGS